jgi:Tol biopolymer transport system component
MRVLTTQAYGESPVAWSPDGMTIALHRRTRLTHQIVLLSVTDGTLTQLKSLEPWPLIGGFSPDGRYLAYSTQVPVPAGRRGLWNALFVLATDGTHEELVANINGSIGTPAWSPDGSRLVFVRQRQGSSTLMTVRVQNGLGQGDPEPVALSVPAEGEPVGSSLVSADGSYYQLYESNSEAGYQADFDPSTRRLTNVTQNTSDLPELVSPDGRYAGVKRVDIETGDVISAVSTSGIITQRAVSPDGTHLFYSLVEQGPQAGPGDLKRIRLMRHTFGTGTDVELHTTESQGYGYFGLTVSGDGAWLAFAINVGESERALMVMPTAGGSSREVRRWPTRANPLGGAMALTPDGRHVIASLQAVPGEPYGLYAISTETGEFDPIWTPVHDVTSSGLSVDGRRIRFSTSTEEQHLWMFPGLFADLSAARGQ